MAESIYSDDALAKYLARGYTIESNTDTMVVLVKNRKVGIFWNLVLSIITSGAWLVVWVLRLIFRRSVVRLNKKSVDGVGADNEAAASSASNFSQNLTPGTKKGLAIGAVVTVSLIIASSVISGQIQQARQVAESYSASQSVLERPLATSVCEGIQDELVDGAIIVFANSNQKRAKKAASSLTVWNAGNYIAKYSWVAEADSLRSRFEESVLRLTTAELSSRIASEGDTDAARGFEKNSNDWANNFRDFALDDCGLLADYQGAYSTVRSVELWANDVANTALAKPWHPKGFEELASYPGFAVAENPGGGCEYSIGSCANFKIVAQNGCPGTLYVEVNLTENNEVVDWGNDTVNGLKVNQVAVMETSFMDGNGTGYWEIVDLSCY